MGGRPRAREVEGEEGEKRRERERGGREVSDLLRLVPNLEGFRARQITQLTQMNPHPMPFKIVTPRKPPPTALVLARKRLHPVLIMRS